MCCTSKNECRVFLLCFTCVILSVLAAIPMFILSYPGDECLLFVSVRGEALIYGNPAGCNFIFYGHCIAVLATIILTYLLFKGPRKGFLRRSEKGTLSNRSLPRSGMTFGTPSMSTLERARVNRIYSTKTVLMALTMALFMLVMAMVITAGYVVSCDELHYETKRQLYGKTTLGTPIKDLSIACYSLFRDTDFHTRFHFDHYEYSGNWHGQFRGYEHGRTHKFENTHEHLIPVAWALELSMGGTWICMASWMALVVMILIRRCHQKSLAKRELAESIEDARIFATSVGRVDSLPMDQLSVMSNQSSVLTQKPQYISTDPSGFSTPQPLLVEQNGVQYVQLGNGMMIPASTWQQQSRQQNIPFQQQHNVENGRPATVLGVSTSNATPYATTHFNNTGSVQHQHQLAPQQSFQQLSNNQQMQQQAAVNNNGNGSQLLQQQLAMLQQQQQQLQQLIPPAPAPVVSQAQSIHSLNKSPNINAVRQRNGQVLQHQAQVNGLPSSNRSSIDGSRAQRLQVDLSNDMGMKCSQI